MPPQLYAAVLVRMHSSLQALAGSQAGVFTTGEAFGAGADADDVRRAVRDGHLVRVRRDAYIAVRRWRDAPPDERFRLSVLAIARTRPADVVSHHAALALHGLPLWEHDPRRIDLLADVSQGVRRHDLWLHPRDENLEVHTVDGVGVVSVARALVRVALTVGRDCAVVAGDAALHRGLVTEEELLDEVARVTPHQGRRRALEAVLQMDGKAESVGESRTRLVFHDLGFTYESQFHVLGDDGAVVARTDFLVEGVIVEFDGRVKYRAEGEDASAILWMEKRREDAIRRRGYPVERVIWSDLERPGLLGARIRAAKALVRDPGAA